MLLRIVNLPCKVLLTPTIFVCPMLLTSVNRIINYYELLLIMLCKYMLRLQFAQLNDIAECKLQCKVLLT